MTYEKLRSDTIERHAARLDGIARGIQRVLRIAYTRVFECEQVVHRLPAGTIRRELFDEMSEERVAAQRDRIRRSCVGDRSIYTICFDGVEVIGVAKTSPAR